MSDVQINLVSDSPAEFDPHAYTIIVKRVILDGEPVFHGRVVELPDLEGFEPTYDEAYNFLIDGIRSSKAAFDEQGRRFPDPLPDEAPEFSGRVTLRMPSWLHAQIDYYARAHQTSLNQYIVTLLSWASTAAPGWIAQTQAIASLTGAAGTTPLTAGVTAWGRIAGHSVTYAAPLTISTVIPFSRGLYDLLNTQFAIESSAEQVTASLLEFEPFTAPPIAKTRFTRSGKRTSR